MVYGWQYKSGEEENVRYMWKIKMWMRKKKMAVKWWREREKKIGIFAVNCGPLCVECANGFLLRRRYRKAEERLWYIVEIKLIVGYISG